MNLLLGFTLPYDGCKTGALAAIPGQVFGICKPGSGLGFWEGDGLFCGGF